MDPAQLGYEAPSTPIPADLPERLPPALLHGGFTHDSDVPVAGLAASPGARVLVIDPCGGGESALAHLAVTGSVVAATAGDPLAFGAILRLKAAAHARWMRLDALKALGLLRAAPEARLALVAEVEGELPPADQLFWQAHADVLAHGLYNGTAEVRLGRLLHDLMRTHLAPEVYRALLYGDRAERVATFARHLDRPGFWRQAMRLCALRGRVVDAGAPSGFTRADPLEALRRLVEVGVPASPIWARAFCNDAALLGILPAHLRTDGHAALRARLPGLEVRAETAAKVLAHAAPGSFDGIDLGNLLDAVDADARRRLLGHAARALRTGGRVVYATFDPLGVQAAAPRRLQSLAAEELAQGDRAPIWGRWCVFQAD